jgi:phage tail sheath protein FI
MSDPIIGVVFRRQDYEARPAIAADMSTIAILGPAPAADPILFPYDTPVKLYSNDTITLAKIGEAGFISDAVRGINNQLGELQRAAQIVFIRTPEGISPDPAIKGQQTMANIMGSASAGTGLWALLLASELVQATPRIVTTPGYTGLLATGVDSVNRTLGGAGYIEGSEYDLTFAGGGPDAVQATGYAVGQADGTLGPAVITSPGAWYTASPTITAEKPTVHVVSAVVANGGTGHVSGDVISLLYGVKVVVAAVTGGVISTVSILEAGDAPTAPGGTSAQVSTTGVGIGATFTLTWSTSTVATYTAVTATLANPVCASAPAVLDQLLAHMVAESAGTSQAVDEQWRETLSSQRIIPLVGGCKITDPLTGATLTRPLAPRIAGVLVRRDHETGGAFHSGCNQPVRGIIGPARRIKFAITDGANEGQQLLAANMGIVVAGEVGSDFAIASGGYVYVGTDNAGEDELWRFYNQTRGRDFIHLTLLRAMRYYLGRFNVSFQTIQVILTTVKNVLRDLQADGSIMGYEVGFQGNLNSPEEIRQGHVVISFKAEEPAPLRKITMYSGRYREAVVRMVADLEAQLGLAA